MKPSSDGTKVDLGEDLLDHTKAVFSASDFLGNTPQESVATKTVLTIQEEIANGEILFNEQLFEEAKKTFRRVLRMNPQDGVAKKFLDEIQRKEIQDLLAIGDNRGHLLFAQKENSAFDARHKVIELLEHDLRLQLDKAEVHAVPDLFSDAAAEAHYVHNLVDSLKDSHPRDVMDLGIAYLEMGLFAVAKPLFEELIKFEEYKISGMYLLGLALIYSGECIEATIRIEPLVRDLTLLEGQKADFLYLMGLAFERLSEHIKAKEFYRRVHLLNPRYRDVGDKIR